MQGYAQRYSYQQDESQDEYSSQSNHYGGGHQLMGGSNQLMGGGHQLMGVSNQLMGGGHQLMGGYGGGGSGMRGGQMQVQKSSSFQSQSKTMMTVFGQEPFCDIRPSSFPPGTDPKIVQCFNRIDRDGNGVVDDRELQAVLSSCNQSFSMRTVHLLMFDFTHSNKRRLGPREFVPLMNCLQKWKGMFQRFDRDRNGSIDSMELGTALNSLGYSVSPVIVNLLVAKFNKSGSTRCSLQYDSFIECCLTVKGLTETFNAKADCGRATFCYEEFLLNVLPFIIA